MTTAELLREFKSIQDEVSKIHDEIMFKWQFNPNPADYYEKIANHMERLEDFETLLFAAVPNCRRIVATKSVVIENEQIVEVPTNVTRSSYEEVEEVIFKGCIPSAGYLKFAIREKDGLRVLCRNMVPKTVKEEYGKKDYHYSRPTSTVYFGPGIYRIDEAQLLGYLFKKEPEKQKKSTPKKRTR